MDIDMDRIRESGDQAAHRARETARTALTGARAKLGDGARRAADSAEDAYEAALKSVEGTARERPLPALALALAVGFIVGMLAMRRGA